MKYFVFFSFLIFTFSACSFSSKTEENTEKYTSESWKTVIPESCTAFFDGCNNCRKMGEDSMAACTRKGCMEYQKPRCVDEK